VELALPSDILAGYTSPAQRARVATEAWAEENAFCVECSGETLKPEPRNTKAIDFRCPRCDAPFQLKSRSSSISGRINDAAYSAMRHSIENDRTPNLFVLRYEREAWSVRDLIVIPRFAFPLSAIECRKPLAPTAQRKGWVGCNILLDKIPEDARIPVVRAGIAESRAKVRRRYAELRGLSRLDVAKRGWTLDVLRIVRELGRERFALGDVYARAEELAKLHPKNRHVNDKIRQQLQVLRDMRLVRFVGKGEYEMAHAGGAVSG